MLIFILTVTGSIPQIVRGIWGNNPSLHYFYNSNILIELIILYSFFNTQIKTIQRRRLLNLLLITSLASGFLLVFHTRFGNRFLNEWVCINNMIFTSWILILLLDIYDDDCVTINHRVPVFWFIIGLFLYTSCTVLIFSLWNYIRENETTLLRNLWIIHDLFNIVMYFVFSYGLLLYNKKQAY
jgi:hypothetical protein